MYLLDALLRSLCSSFNRAALSHIPTGRKIPVSLVSDPKLQVRGTWKGVTDILPNSLLLFSPSVPVQPFSCKISSPGRCPKTTSEGSLGTLKLPLFSMYAHFSMGTHP